MSKPKIKLGKPQRYYRERYLRNLPTSFCAGCGNGTILNSFVRAVDELITAKELRQRDLLAVSGIGSQRGYPVLTFELTPFIQPMVVLLPLPRVRRL